MTNNIETNDIFDKLTNNDIATHYRDKEFWLMRSDFLGAFAYWVVAQSPYDAPDITKPLVAFLGYIELKMPCETPVKFTYDELRDFVSEDKLAGIPDILELNERKNGRDGMGFCSRYDKPDPDDDFIDLGALSRNVKFMIMREQITQST
jgi:hypothetical protein